MDVAQPSEATGGNHSLQAADRLDLVLLTHAFADEVQLILGNMLLQRLFLLVGKSTVGAGAL